MKGLVKELKRFFFLPCFVRHAVDQGFTVEEAVIYFEDKIKGGSSD